MHLVRFLLVVLPCVLLFAGSGVAQTAPEKQPAPKHPIEETKTFSTRTSTIKKRERRVIKSAAAWKVAWQQLYGNRWPKPELPPVNFKRHMVVLAAMGQFGSTGFSIGVRKVVQHERGLNVTVVESRPGFGCLLGQMMTYPATVAIVPRTRGKVRLIEVEERVLSCH